MTDVLAWSQGELNPSIRVPTTERLTRGDPLDIHG